MRVSYRKLKQLVRKGLQEGSERGHDVTLSDGQVVPFGSPRHIEDMQSVLTGLETLKKQHRYGSAARSKFADAGAHLKRLVNRPSRVEVDVDTDVGAEDPVAHDRKPKKKKKIPPRTFAQLEGDPPGHGGYGRGSSGLGQYLPGFNRRK